ncbi:MAG: aldo/keto reductase [Paracoccaceae bacterium]|nr:MAG: aldo/keto reductase [Paracoccaceae bacterium]
MTGLIVLPGTALRLSRFCLGGNRLGGDLDQAESFALLDAFAARGGNFIDTARVYADWLPQAERSCSERTIGRWIAARGAAARVVVATKGGHPPLEGPHRARLDAASLREDALASRDNLGLPRIDLFYLHRDDPATPVRDILAVLEDLRRDGVIAHYAASNWALPRLQAAQEAARAEGWQGFVASQVEWNLAHRNADSRAADLVTADVGMLAFHAQTGLPLVPYSAQARGYFDKLTAGRLDAATARLYDNPQSRAAARGLADAAAARDLTPTQAMLGQMIARKFPVFPVIGCRTAAQIGAAFAAG